MKSVNWDDNGSPAITRCPSCGAPPSLESKTRGACNYCGTAYETAPRCRSSIEITSDRITFFADCEPIGELVSKGLVTMNEGRQAMWPYYARCHGT